MTPTDPQRTFVLKRSSSQLALKLFSAVFALIPCGLLGFILAPSVFLGLELLFSSWFPVALFAYLILGGVYFGIYSIVGWLLGATLATKAIGLTYGALSSAFLVLLPYGMMFAVAVGWYEPRFHSGMDNYGPAFYTSLLSITPFVVYFVLAIVGWRSRSSSSEMACG